MKIRLTIYILICLLSVFASEQIEASGKYEYKDLILEEHPELLNYTVRSGHPRLIITPDNIETIRVNIDTYWRYKSEYPGHPNLFQVTLNEAFNDPIANESEWTKNQDLIEKCAFIYQIGVLPDFDYHGWTPEQYGTKGVEALMKVGSFADRGYDPKWVFGHHNHGCRSRYTALPLGYDWLYDLLTAEQRQTLVDRMISDCYYAFNPDDLYRHDWLGVDNWPLHTKETLSGFAFYGDGIADAEAKQILDILAYGTHPLVDGAEYKPSLLNGGTLDWLHIVFGGGFTIDGHDYMGMHSQSMPFYAAWRTATGQNAFDFVNFYKNLPHRMAYSHIPSTPNYFMPLQQERGINPYTTITAMVWAAFFNALSGGLSGDAPDEASLAKWVCGMTDYYSRTGGFPVLHYFSIHDPSVESKTPAELKLPLSRLFKGQGWFSSRSSWEDADATMVGFWCHNWGGGRMAQWSNGFTIWKNKGPLFWSRGTSKPGIRHSAIGWSTLMLDGHVAQAVGGDDVTTLKAWMENPGHRKAGGFKLVESVPGKYDYLRGDAAGAYYQRSPLCKTVLSKFDRDFVYFHGAETGQPDMFLIRDRIKDADYANVHEKHLLFQANYNPELRETSWTGDESLGTEIAPGKWLYNNARHITIRNDVEGFNEAHGKAYLRVLYPQNTKVYKIGGPGHQFDDWFGEPVEVNENATPEERFYKGEYRLHVTSPTAAREESYLFAIEATDSTDDSPVEMQKLESTGLIGARIDKYIALFSKDDTQIATSEITIPAGMNGTFNILFTDLLESQPYNISLGEQKIGSSVEASGEGTIYLEDITIAESQVLKIQYVGFFDRYSYELTLEANIQATDMSGATFNTRSNTLFILQESSPIFECDRDGNVLRTIVTTQDPWTFDLEGISYVRTEDDGKDVFALIDENLGRFVIVKIGPEDTEVDLDSAESHPINAIFHESIPYDADNDTGVFYSARRDGEFFFVVNYTNGEVDVVVNPFDPKKKGLAIGGSSATDMFMNKRLSPAIFVLRYREVMEMTVHGDIVSRYTIPETITGKLEGLTFIPDSKEIFIVRESSKSSINFYRFEATLINQPGDVDGDGDVDIFDLFVVASAFGTVAGDAGFKPACDFDGDGDVDINDLYTCGSNFGVGV